MDESIDGVQRSVSYQYDATGKLLTETILQAGQSSSIAYTYDAMGNRLTKGITTNYSYNRNDQIISETTAGIITSYAWDSNGNLLKKTSCDGVVSYSWSSSNKLLSIDDQVNQRQVSYQYDGQDNRIGKVVKQNGQSIETKYLVDSERPYSEVVLERSRIDQGNWSETVYLHTPEGLGDLLTQDQTGQVNHLYQDAQGSTRLVTDKQGTTQSTFDYDAFGNALLSNKPNDTIKHRYVGEYLDQDSGFYHLRARDYDPKIGRFVSRDSFEGIRNNPITLNPYLYANADPINGVDPSGHFGLGGMMAAMDIRTTLSNIQFDFGMNFLESAMTGESSYSAKSMGWGVIASLAPVAMVKTFGKGLKITSKIGSKGKVAYPASKVPLKHELETAEYIAEKLGVGIYFKGGRSTPGADAFISGKLWEFKTITGSPTSAKNGIAGAVEQFEKFNKGAPIKVILDGRGNLTKEAFFIKGIGKVQSTQRNRVTEVMAILKDGSIIYWP